LNRGDSFSRLIKARMKNGIPGMIGKTIPTKPKSKEAKALMLQKILINKNVNYINLLAQQA